MLGAYSEWQAANAEIKAKFENPEVMAKVGEKLNTTVNSLTVLEFQVQVVAGLNHKVKATINDGQTVIISSYTPLPHTNEPMEITSVENA